MDEVASTGATIIITKRGKAVARLAPATEKRPQALGSLEAALEIADDDFSLPALISGATLMTSDEKLRTSGSVRTVDPRK